LVWNAISSIVFTTFDALWLASVISLMAWFICDSDSLVRSIHS
jgi:hypothetical protein